MEKRFEKGIRMVSICSVLPIIYVCLLSFDRTAYYQVLLAEPGYLLKFWKSLALCTIIAVGQTLVSCMGGFAFAKFYLKGSKILFWIMAIFMIVPIQVTLLPNYILLEKAHLLNTWWALILPGIFSPFGTVWLAFVIKSVPSSWMEAASLDGAGIFVILYKIVLPTIRPAWISLFILSFVDSWNMVEQPMVFLSDSAQYPFSIFLAGLTGTSTSVQAVCGILSLIPVTFFFLYYSEELREGIGNSIWG